MKYLIYSDLWDGGGFENRGRPWPREWEGPALKAWEGFSFQNRYPSQRSREYQIRQIPRKDCTSPGTMSPESGSDIILLISDLTREV